MVTAATAIDALSAALALARAEGRAVRSMKDLLCDACGEGVAVRAGGYCHRCADEMTAHAEARADEMLPGIMAAQGPTDGAEYLAAMYDDAECAAGLAGLLPGKF